MAACWLHDHLQQPGRIVARGLMSRTMYTSVYHVRGRNQAMATSGSFSTSAVPPADGTTTGYRTTGRGPGLILLPGALLTARDFDGLARALGGRGFTVHPADRRRGGPRAPATGPQTRTDH